MAVHLFGRPVEWEALQPAVPQEVSLARGRRGGAGRALPRHAVRRARRRRLPVLPPAQIVTTGDGGAVTTDEAVLDAAVRRLRNHGWETLGDMPAPGFNYRLPDILCAVGIAQVARLKELLARAERVAGWYRSGCATSSRRPELRKATATARRPTSSSSTGATKRSPACVRTASRRRSGPGRSTASRRTARRALFRERTAPSSAHSRFRSRRRRRRRRSTASSPPSHASSEQKLDKPHLSVDNHYPHGDRDETNG